MGNDQRVLDLRGNDEAQQRWAICSHAFSNLSNVSPVVFLYLLKACYTHGTCKATAKFRVLQQVVNLVLHNAPQPCPAIFVAYCLNVLPSFETFCEGFSHLMLSALRRFLKTGTTLEDLFEAKLLAAKLFLDIAGGYMVHSERIVVKILKVFDVSLINIEQVICNANAKSAGSLKAATTFVEQYIFGLIESQSYTTAVALLEHFSIRLYEESFLLKMMDGKQYSTAQKWAAFMGKPMLCTLVKEFVAKNLLKQAYVILKENNLLGDFPEVCYNYQESSLKKLAEKGLWDIAEARTNSDRQLLEYLVYLAMEAGYSEKVDELCDRYSLKGFIDVRKPEENLPPSHYLHLSELVIEDVIWVDEVEGLSDATCQIEGCKVLGIDCEWRPNFEKGSKSNKVSIMQIASETSVYIFDLIKLFEDVPDKLDECLIRILHSSRILKLGYNFQCDMKQLASSYEKLKCFKQYEMLLDIQNVFKESRGGLSGLAKKILGAALNKTRRNSNWEQRPLTQNQIEYAALDAAVLVHIFMHVRSHSLPGSVSDRQADIEWKSHIISHSQKAKKTKKEKRSKIKA